MHYEISVIFLIIFEIVIKAVFSGMFIFKISLFLCKTGKYIKPLGNFFDQPWTHRILFYFLPRALPHMYISPPFSKEILNSFGLHPVGLGLNIKENPLKFKTIVHHMKSKSNENVVSSTGKAGVGYLRRPHWNNECCVSTII